MDLTVQAMAGIMWITGYPDQPPVKAGPALCDFFAGIHLYGAILTALYDRERTGVGREVEASMFESVYASLMSSLGLYFGSGGEVPSGPATGTRGSRKRRTTSIPRRTATWRSSASSEQHWVSWRS